MKKLYTLSFLMASVLSFGQISDSFTGTGALTSNGWVSHSGTANQITISSGSLTYPGFTSAGNKAAIVAGNNEDVNKASTAPITGIAYYSAILNVPNTTGLHANSGAGDYFLANTATVGTTNVTAFSARLFVKAGSAENTFNLGLLNNSGTGGATSYLSTDYPVNTPVFIVVKYDLSTNTASLFVNPTLGGTEGTANTTNATGATAAPAQLAGLVIRQGGNATAGTGNVEIDELRLGTTWASVTTAALAVKQNSIEGLKVYPNPVTNGTLFIDTNADAAKEVVIFDVLGKQVVKTTTQNAVNVSKLNAGVYIVKITEEGQTATRKLVIK